MRFIWMAVKNSSPIRLSACVVLLCASSLTGLAQVKTVVLDGHSKGKIYDGIGALSAGASSRLLVDYPEPQRSEILDYLFKPGYGAALQHLKVEVGADVNSTDGAEPSHMRSRSDHDYTRGYEWWLLEEAHKRNPNIIVDVLPWGAPGWIGDGKLYSPDIARYLADFIKGASQFHHLKIGYAGIWNEKPDDPSYVKELRRTLDQEHLNEVKIVCCDEYPSEQRDQWTIVKEIQKDAELDAAVAVIGVHYPQENGKMTTPETARQTGKPLWASEDQPNSGGGPIVSREWAMGGRILAHLYNKNYLEGSLTKTEIWSPITSYYDILAAPNSGLMYANTPWSGHYEVQSTIWVTAHTTQFAQPGWQYLDSSSGVLPGKGSYVALRSPNRKDWSVVVETIEAGQPQAMTLEVTGGLAATVVHVWKTNGDKTFERVADLSPQDGKFTYKFDPDSIYSLTTTTGQGKGTAEPPPARPFPFPYRDDFEQTELTRAARYLSDQDGAFEVQPCLRRSGHCLEQVITNQPIPWGPLPDPFSLAGDVTWSDYRVAADVLLVGPGPLTLMGRIDSADVFSDQKAIWPSGYILSLQPDGAWTLSSTTYKKTPVTLGTGHAKILADSWHHVELAFQGTRVTAKIDGVDLIRIDDTSHRHGMFGIGTSWNRAQFDNLTVTRE